MSESKFGSGDIFDQSKGTSRGTPERIGRHACRGSARSRQGKQGMDRQNRSDGVSMAAGGKREKICLDSGSEEKREERSRAVCRKEH